MNEDTIIVTLVGGPHDGLMWEVPAVAVFELVFGGPHCRYRFTDDPKIWRYIEPEVEA